MAKKITGFTLIELLIVVAIIGILAAIAVPNFLNARIRAQVARVKSDYHTLGVAQEMYRADHNRYTNDYDQEDDQVDEQGWKDLTTPIAYMSTILSDPFIPKPGGLFLAGSSANDEVVTFYELGSGSDNYTHQLPVVHAYYIECVGPDGGDEGAGPDDFPFNTIVNNYDASNGVQSRGDIIGLGGLWTKGCFWMDGRRIGDRCNP